MASAVNKRTEHEKHHKASFPSKNVGAAEEPNHLMHIISSFGKPFPRVQRFSTLNIKM